MREIKKILLGIALILFGLWATYFSALTSWYPLEITGLIVPFVGIIIVVLAYFSPKE